MLLTEDFQNEPQNVEQGILNVEVSYITSAVRNFLFNIRYFLLKWQER